jgi:hypothetical protein
MEKNLSYMQFLALLAHLEVPSTAQSSSRA